MKPNGRHRSRRPAETVPETMATRFLSQIQATRAHEDLFEDFYVDVDREREGVAALRRRRRRVTNALDTPMKAVSLVEENGTLYWRDGVPARPVARRRGRRGLDATSEGTVVLTQEFPVLAPNKVVAAVAAIDRRLNPAIEHDLQSRLRRLRPSPAGRYEFDRKPPSGPYAGRTLLCVHGTFSSATNMLNEFQATGAPGLEFLARGEKKYDQVLFFEHPTLSVSPMLNALELGRAMAGSSGSIDVIAHSRGGLVTRWWLEAFGASLQMSRTSVRAVLAGSPLNGTSLAAPDRIQHALGLISNIATFAEKTLQLVGAANPYLWVAGKLIEVIVSITGALAKTPLIDAMAALIPGLAGQSRVGNNYEINRLRLGPCTIDPDYYAVISNFETKDPGWQFWKNFRTSRITDLATDAIFTGDNDLVVDTSSMTDLGVRGLKVQDSCSFGTSGTVWHCNYFRQQKSIDFIRSTFRV